MANMTVTVSPIASDYKWVTFRVTWAMNGGWYSYDQMCEIWNGGTLLHSSERRFNTGQSHSQDVTVSVPTFAPGRQQSFTLTGKSYPRNGSEPSGSASGTGYTWFNPTISASSFSLGGGEPTRRTVNFKNLSVPNGERLSYEKFDGSGYQQTASGVANGSVLISGIPHNTKKSLRFGMVRSNIDDGFLGNGESRYVLVEVYPTFKAFTKGRLTVVRDELVPSTIFANWKAWSNFGDTTGKVSSLVIRRASNGEQLAKVNINVLNDGSVSVPNMPIDEALHVYNMIEFTYFDGNKIEDISETQFVDIGSTGYYCNADGQVTQILGRHYCYEDGKTTPIIGIPYVKT